MGVSSGDAFLYIVLHSPLLRSTRKYKPSFLTYWLFCVESFNMCSWFMGFSCLIPWLVMPCMFLEVAQQLHHTWQWDIISPTSNVFLETKVPKSSELQVLQIFLWFIYMIFNGNMIYPFQIGFLSLTDNM